jgi:hypothetical protein
VEEGVVVVVVLLLLLLLLLCSWLVIGHPSGLRGFSSSPLLSSLVYTSRDPNSALFRPSLFFRTDNTGAAHQTTHTHTDRKLEGKKKILFQGSFRMGRKKTKFFLGGENQAGTAAAADWVVVLTRRDTKRFHGSNTGCWLVVVVVVVVLRLFVVWFSALMVIGCWQFPVRLGAAQEKRGAETTPTRETS